MNERLEKLKAKNKSLELLEISNKSFKNYGNILDSNEFLEYFDYLDQHTHIPEQNNVYVAHEENILKELKDTYILSRVFGFVDVQIIPLIQKVLKPFIYQSVLFLNYTLGCFIFLHVRQCPQDLSVALSYLWVRTQSSLNLMTIKQKKTYCSSKRINGC